MFIEKYLSKKQRPSSTFHFVVSFNIHWHLSQDLEPKKISIVVTALETKKFLIILSPELLTLFSEVLCKKGMWYWPKGYYAYTYVQHGLPVQALISIN